MTEDELVHPRTEDLEVGPVLAALADGNRRRVVAELAQRPEQERLCASFDLPVGKSSRTRHWRVLREAGLVYQRNAGNGLYMRLRKEDLDRRFPGLIQAVITADASAVVTTKESETRGPLPPHARCRPVALFTSLGSGSTSVMRSERLFEKPAPPA